MPRIETAMIMRVFVFTLGALWLSGLYGCDSNASNDESEKTAEAATARPETRLAVESMSSAPPAQRLAPAERWRHQQLERFRALLTGQGLLVNEPLEWDRGEPVVFRGDPDENYAAVGYLISSGSEYSG